MLRLERLEERAMLTGDLTGDGMVNAADLNELLFHWPSYGPDTLDEILFHWGEQVPQPIPSTIQGNASYSDDRIPRDTHTDGERRRLDTLTLGSVELLAEPDERFGRTNLQVSWSPGNSIVDGIPTCTEVEPVRIARTLEHRPPLGYDWGRWEWHLDQPDNASVQHWDYDAQRWTIGDDEPGISPEYAWLEDRPGLSGDISDFTIDWAHQEFEIGFVCRKSGHLLTDTVMASIQWRQTVDQDSHTKTIQVLHGGSDLVMWSGAQLTPGNRYVQTSQLSYGASDTFRELTETSSIPWAEDEE